MSDQVGNPEDRLSRIEVLICCSLQLEDSKRDYVKSIDSLQSEKDDLNNKLKKANDGM